MPKSQLSHLDSKGKAKMVDTTAKNITERTAIAKGAVVMSPSTLKLILSNGIPKGDVFSTARIAGIMGAKKTSLLIPLCHPLSLTSIDVDFRIADNSAVEIIASAKTVDRTGVEMESLTAVTVAALTIYDMCKAVQKDIEIREIVLLAKSGGKSGKYRRK